MTRSIAIEGVTARNLRVDEIMMTLPDERRELLEYMFRFLHKVAAHGEINLMNPTNLGMMFAAIFVRYPLAEGEEVKPPANNRWDSTLVCTSPCSLF